LQGGGVILKEIRETLVYVLEEEGQQVGERVQSAIGGDRGGSQAEDLQQGAICGLPVLTRA
jgi:hypothetical protein